MEKKVAIETLQTRTEEFLSWVEERKTEGFVGREIINLHNILEETLKQECFQETIEFVRDQIRHWAQNWWNPTIIGSLHERHKRKTGRAEVLEKFPMILMTFLGTLDRVEDYVLEKEQEEIFTNIKKRMAESMENLDLDGGESGEKSEEEREKDRKKRERKRSKMRNKGRRRNFKE